MADQDERTFDLALLSEALREVAEQERERAARQITREAATSLALRSDQQPFTPPWSAVPLTRVRRMQRTNPATRADFSFPTVYEENRAEKIKDLAAANELKIISHRRLAELVSNELALDQYDYDVELGQIQKEQQNPLLAPPTDPAMMQGSGTLWDAINKRSALTGKPVGDQSPVPPGVMPAGGPPGGPASAALGTAGGRMNLHGPSADSFRRAQAGRPGLSDADTTGP